MHDTAAQRQQRVGRRYAAAAQLIIRSPATGAVTPDEADKIGQRLYRDQLDPDLTTIAAGSIGCGNPVAVADLHPGETVLDLGSGVGLDVLLSARRVGPTGRAIGLDMTSEMLELARHNARQARVSNAEFLRGTIENIPLPDASIDVVISNCVIALSANKRRVFAEIQRVLRPGGRLGISDVIAEPDLTAEQRAPLRDAVGARALRDQGSDQPATNTAECLGSALTEAEYRVMLHSAGLRDVTVTVTHAIGSGLHAAVIKAGR